MKIGSNKHAFFAGLGGIVRKRGKFRSECLEFGVTFILFKPLRDTMQTIAFRVCVKYYQFLNEILALHQKTDTQTDR